MPAAAACRCPLLLLRKNVNQCHLTTQMQKTKRFKYIHNSLFQSLSLSKKRGTMRLFLNLQKNRRFPPQDVVQPSFIDEILSLSLIFIRCMKNLCDLTKNQSTNPTRPTRPRVDSVDPWAKTLSLSLSPHQIPGVVVVVLIAVAVAVAAAPTIVDKRRLNS